MARQAPTVETASGRVAGRWDDDLAVFLGVPFAAAPTGERRFAAPRPHQGWTGVRQCVDVAASAPQGPSRIELIMGKVRFGEAEDCLTLNIWTPSTGGERLPVLVWIHGGGYSSGSGAWPWYAGDRLSRNGRIVVVTINYRLGALGYMYVPEMAGQDAGAANRGILDQIAAVRWVRENIAAFGGDPTNITVAGQSGGGAAVACMMSIPSAKPLFKRGILQSAALLPPFPVDEATRIGRRFREAIGAKTLDDLRAQPVDAILQAQAVIAAEEIRFADFTPPFQPVLDGEVLKLSFVEALMSGAGAGIDVIVGVNRAEMKIRPPRVRQLPRVLAHAVRNRIKLSRPPAKLFGSKQTTREQVVARFAHLVGPERASSVVDGYVRSMPAARMDGVLREMLADEYDYRALRVAEDQARLGCSAWFYSFDFCPRGSPFGSCHTLELPFVFDNPERWQGALMLGRTSAGEVHARGRAMHDAWTAFVATGSPNVSGGAEWPAYEPHRRAVMHFGDERPTVVEEPLTEGLRMWERAVGEALEAGRPVGDAR
jgi:para-nitrobenzyl esterase